MSFRNKLNYLIVLPSTELGGAEQLLKMVALYHKYDNVYVYFLCKRTTSQWDDYAAFLHLKYASTDSKAGSVLNFIQFIRTSNIQWERVYTSHVTTNGILGFLRKTRLLKTKYFIARESTSILTRFTGRKLLIYKSMYKIGYKRMDLLVCQTKEMYEGLVSQLPVLKKSINIKVIPNPIDLSSIDNIIVENEIIEKYGSYIVAAGRLIDEKGFDILINVYTKLLSEYKELHLLILGEGPQRQDLEALINKLGVNNRIHLPGFVKNVYPFFKYARICVVSSRVEGFPNVLLQMMSQNERVVATNCAGGIQQIKGLFMAETENENSLFTALDQALKTEKMNTRKDFDNELELRSVNNFMQMIKEEINA